MSKYRFYNDLIQKQITNSFQIQLSDLINTYNNIAQTGRNPLYTTEVKQLYSNLIQTVISTQESGYMVPNNVLRFINDFRGTEPTTPQSTTSFYDRATPYSVNSADYSRTSIMHYRTGSALSNPNFASWNNSYSPYNYNLVKNTPILHVYYLPISQSPNPNEEAYSHGPHQAATNIHTDTAHAQSLFYNQNTEPSRAASALLSSSEQQETIISASTPSQPMIETYPHNINNSSQHPSAATFAASTAYEDDVETDDTFGTWFNKVKELWDQMIYNHPDQTKVFWNFQSIYDKLIQRIDDLRANNNEVPSFMEEALAELEERFRSVNEDYGVEFFQIRDLRAGTEHLPINFLNIFDNENLSAADLSNERNAVSEYNAPSRNTAMLTSATAEEPAAVVNYSLENELADLNSTHLTTYEEDNLVIGERTPTSSMWLE